VYRVDDQGWDETITPSEFDAQPLTNQETREIGWSSNGWDYVDVENQFLADYSAGNNYTAIRLKHEWDDSLSSSWVYNTTELRLGSDPAQFYRVFRSREATSNHPYLEVQYALPENSGQGIQSTSGETVVQSDSSATSPEPSSPPTWVEVGRGRDFERYRNPVTGEYKQIIYPRPIHTWDGSRWVSYVFEDKGDHYQVQHPIVSARFYPKRTEFWDENFSECVVADEGWSVEQLKNGNWRGMNFTDAMISCDIVSEDEVRLVRRASSPQGTLRTAYIFGRGSVKIMPEFVASENITVRFRWDLASPARYRVIRAKLFHLNPSRYLGTAEGQVERDIGVSFFKGSARPRVNLSWWKEAGDENMVIEVNATPKRLLIHFGDFELGRGQTAVLDPWFTSDPRDGEIWQDEGEYYQDYVAVHDAPEGTVNDNYFNFCVGQSPQGSMISRGFVFFDTSSLPDDSTITSAKLRLFLWINYSDVDFDVVVQSGQPSYPHYPLRPEDFYYDHYDGNGGSLHISPDDDTPGYRTITLNESGTSWINKTGLTKLCLRSSRDVENRPPDPAKEESVVFLAGEDPNEPPELIVTFTVPSPPSIPDVENARVYWKLENSEITENDKWVQMDGPEGDPVKGIWKATISKNNFSSDNIGKMLYWRVRAWASDGQEHWSPVYRGGRIHNPPYVVKIQPSADVTCVDSASNFSIYASQLKFDLSSIPPCEVISARLWLYVLDHDNWEGLVKIYGVEDQSWDENVSPSDLNTQLLAYLGFDYRSFKGVGEWDWLDVLKQVKADLRGGRNFTSFRLCWPDGGGPTIWNDVENSDTLKLGQLDKSDNIFTELVKLGSGERENYEPYLEVAYELPRTRAGGLPPMEDSSTRQAYENVTWGNNATLYIGRQENGPQRGWLKFDLSTLPENFARAKLWLYSYEVSGTEAIVQVRAIDDDNWVENEINWLNMPSAGEVLDARAVFEVGWHSWDVTPFIEEQLALDNLASFALVDLGENLSPDHAALFDSREWCRPPYLEILTTQPQREVRVYIDPVFQGGLAGDNLTYTITIVNKGALDDNYSLSLDNEWAAALENDLLEVPAGENRTMTLTVTIPSVPVCTRDNITVTVTGTGVSDKFRCIAHRGKADLSFLTLYKVGADLAFLLSEGSPDRLSVKFYTYPPKSLEAENIFWTGVTPAYVEDVWEAGHSLGVKVADLVWTDDAGNVIRILDSIMVTKDDLFARIAEILGYWSEATFAERDELFAEIFGILGQWPEAP
jgi:hypothetical protein